MNVSEHDYLNKEMSSLMNVKYVAIGPLVITF